MAAAAAASLSSVVTPSSSSSSSSFSPLHFDHSFSLFPPLKPKPFKPFTFKPHYCTLSPLPLLFPLHHRCHSSVGFSYTTTDELVENPDEEQQLVEGSGEIEPEEAEESNGSDSANDRRLFVGGWPRSMTLSQLSELFAEVGRVTNAEIIYNRETFLSRGFGFVTMGSIEEAKEAIRMFDGSQVGGRTIKVNFPKVRRGGERKLVPKFRSTKFVDTPHKIYAGNLAWDVTSQFLGAAFAEQPGFLSARVNFNRETGKPQGYGFISFSSAEAAESALQAMNGVVLEGRPLRLRWATKKNRSTTNAYGEQSEVLGTSIDS